MGTTVAIAQGGSVAEILANLTAAVQRARRKKKDRMASHLGSL